MKLTIDLTPWLRGPTSGVGLTAFHSAKALLELLNQQKSDPKTQLRFVSKDQKVDPQFEKKLSSKITWINPFRRWSGSNDEIFHSYSLQLAELRNSKRVLTVQDCWTLWPNDYQEKKFQKVQARKLIHALKRAHALVTPTEAVRLKLAEWDSGLLLKTFVVPWASTLEGIEGSGKTLGAVDVAPRLRDYLLENRPFILVVASLEYRKNHRLVLEAMKSLKGLDLVLAGGPGFGVERITEEIGQIPADLRIEQFKELDPKSLATLYDRSTAFVSASRDEGFGLPVLEAMSRGKAVFLSKIPAHEEIAGNAALYFDVEEGAPVLKEYLEAIKSDSYVQKDLKERSLKRAQLFSWMQTAKKLYAVYERLSS